MAAGPGSVLLLEAPSGFGKTAFMAGHQAALAADGVATAWVSLEPRDGPERAKAVIAAALNLDPVEALEELVAAFHVKGRNGVLFLDNLDLAPEDTRHEVLTPLFTFASPKLRVIAAGRRLSGFRLAKLKAASIVRVLGTRELRLDRADIEELCRGLPARTVRAVETLSDGWPMAAAALCERARAGGALPAWRDCGVLDYVDQEIASGLSEADLAELTACALADDLEPEVFRALTGAVEPQERLADLAAKLPGLMLDAAPQQGGWRLIPALRAYLQSRLRGLAAAERGEVAERTSRVAAAQGRTAAAVRIAIGASRPDLALELVREAGGLNLWLTKGMSEVREVLRAAGPDVLAGDPLLQLMAAVERLKEGAIPEALAYFRSAVSAPGDACLDHNADVARVALLVYGCRTPSLDDARSVEALTAFAEREPIWSAFVRSAACVLEIQAGNFEAASESALSALAAAKPESLPYATLFLNYHLASIAAARGQTKRARDLLRSGKSILRSHFAGDSGAETIGAVETAELDYELGRLASARARIRLIAPRLAHMEGWFDIYAAALETLARLILHDEGLAPARRHLAASLESLRRRDLGRVADFLGLVDAVITGEAILTGASPEGASPSVPASLPDAAGWREREAWGLARVYQALRDGALDQAVALADEIVADAARSGARRPAFRAHLLRTAALEQLRDEPAAAAAFEAALAIGQETAFRRGFLDFGGEGSLRRLRRLADAGDERGRFARLVLSQTDAARRGSADARLTRRELEVLLGVEGGASDKAVGRRLGVSEHAVRFHLKNIFLKLQAHSRIEALDRARRLGLLDPT